MRFRSIPSGISARGTTARLRLGEDGSKRRIGEDLTKKTRSSIHNRLALLVICSSFSGRRPFRSSSLNRPYFTQASPNFVAQVEVNGGEIARLPIAIPGWTISLTDISPDGSNALLRSAHISPRLRRTSSRRLKSTEGRSRGSPSRSLDGQSLLRIFRPMARTHSSDLPIFHPGFAELRRAG